MSYKGKFTIKFTFSSPFLHILSYFFCWTIYGFSNNEKSWFLFHGLSMVSIEMNAQAKIYYKSCKKCWNFIRIKRIAFIVLATKRNIQWVLYDNKLCCYLKGKQMNFASRTKWFVIFKFSDSSFFASFFLSIVILEMGFALSIKQESDEKKRILFFMIEVSNQNISPATT